MGSFLHMAVHCSIPCRSQVPHNIYTYFCGTGTDRSTCCQCTPHSKTKHGAIPPLSGEIFATLGTRYPILNLVVSLEFRLG